MDEDLRSRVVAIARGILDRQVEVLEGCRLLSSLLGGLSLEDNDEDHRAFILIDSETDALPVGRVRGLWDEGALRDLEPRIQEAQRWAWDIAEPHCANIVRRFAP
jgi:hypothetical protein